MVVTLEILELKSRAMSKQASTVYEDWRNGKIGKTPLAILPMPPTPDVLKGLVCLYGFFYCVASSVAAKEMPNESTALTKPIDILAGYQRMTTVAANILYSKPLERTGKSLAIWQAVKDMMRPTTSIDMCCRDFATLAAAYLGPSINFTDSSTSRLVSGLFDDMLDFLEGLYAEMALPDIEISIYSLDLSPLDNLLLDEDLNAPVMHGVDMGRLLKANAKLRRLSKAFPRYATLANYGSILPKGSCFRLNGLLFITQSNKTDFGKKTQLEVEQSSTRV